MAPMTAISGMVAVRSEVSLMMAEVTKENKDERAALPLNVEGRIKNI
jgi:hypothetical protein